MAPVGWDFVLDDDPWRVSAFVSAVMELLLSILMLLGASISFITFQFVTFFGLEPPCTYIGCVHRTYIGNRRGLVRYPSWSYAKLPSEDHSAGNRHRYNQNYHHTSERDYISMDDSCTESEMEASEEQFRIGHDNEERLALCHKQQSKIYTCLKQYRSDGETFFDEDTVPLFSARSISSSSDTVDNSDLCSVSVNASDPHSVDIVYNETMSNDGENWDLNSNAEPPQQKLPVRCIMESEQAELKESCNGEMNGDECQEVQLQEDEIDSQILFSEEAKTSSEEEGDLEDYHYSNCEERKLEEEAKTSSEEEGGLEDYHNNNCGDEALGDNQNSNCGDRKLENEAAEGNAFEVAELSIPFPSNSQLPNMNEKTSSFLLGSGTTVVPCHREEGKKAPSYVTSESEFLLHEDVTDELQSNVVGSVDLMSIDKGIDKSATEGFMDMLEGHCISQTGNMVQQELKAIYNPEQFSQEQGIIDDTGCPIHDSDDVVVNGDDSDDMGADQATDAVVNGDDDIAKSTMSILNAISNTDSQNHLELMSKITTEIVYQCEHQKAEDIFLQSSVMHGSDSHPDREKSGTHDHDDLHCKSDIDEDRLCNANSVVDVKDEDHEVSESEQGQEESLEALKAALNEEKKLLAALEQELENERNAAAVATSEAMAMISRLQEEKAAMQMEVQQIQRMSEEKADYDEQAMTLLKEILLKREKEKFALEKEVEMYREKLLAEQVEKLKRTKSMKEQANMPLSSNSISDDFNLESQNDANCLQLQAKDQQITPTKPHEEQEFKEHLQESKHAIHPFPQEPRESGRSIFCTDDEETQFILERLWVLEEELQQLRAKDELVTLNYRDSINNGASMTNSDSSLGKTDCDKVVVHDVYEVQDAAKPPSRCPEDSEPLDVMPTNCDLTPSCVLDYGRLNPNSPPRLPLARRLFSVKEEHGDFNDDSQQENSWSLESNPGEDIWKHSPQQIVARDGKAFEIDKLHHLTARLEALEADRELLRETLQSFKHREAEVHLLQEIAQHLRELRIAGYKISDSATYQSETSSLFDQGYEHTPEKRHFCNTSVTPLSQQKSI